MEYQLITEAEYKHLLKKLDSINSAIENKLHPEKKIYSEEEIRKLLSTSKRTLIKWRSQKLIKFSKIQGKIFYTWENIEQFLKENEVGGISR
jgi:hypothetical protein